MSVQRIILIALIFCAFITTQSFAIDPTYLEGIPGSDQIVCGQDTNNDGDFDGSQEMAECENGICPFGAEACLPDNSEASCPLNGFLDPVRDMCQLEPDVTCPSGYTWDKSIDQCVKQVKCLDNGTFNPDRDLCEKQITMICEPGYTYDAGRDLCTKEVACTAAGAVFNYSKDRCEKVISFECPAEYTYSALLDRCTQPPQCPGGYYNKNLKKCTTAFTMGCPDPYVEVNGRCEKAPECPIGYNYDPASNSCNRTTVLVESATEMLQAPGTSTKLDYLLAGFTDSSDGYRYIFKGCGGNGANNMINGKYFTMVSISDALYYSLKTSNCINYCGDVSRYGWACKANDGSMNYVVKKASNQPAYYILLHDNPCPRAAVAKTVRSRYFPGYGYFYFTACTFKNTNTCQGISAPVNGGQNCKATKLNQIFIKTYTCPDGFQLQSNNTCESTEVSIVNPFCTGGQMDYAKDVCYRSLMKQCPTNMTYSSTADLCVANPYCNSTGILDLANDRCNLQVTKNCGTYHLDEPNNTCYSDPVCYNGGIYDSKFQDCRSSVTKDCGLFYYQDTSDQNRCVMDIVCPTDSYYPLKNTIRYSNEANICMSDVVHSCEDGYAYSGLPAAMCEAATVCPEGGTYNVETNACEGGLNTCPLGEEYACTVLNGAPQVVNGCANGYYDPNMKKCVIKDSAGNITYENPLTEPQTYCSDVQCVNIAEAPVDTETADESAYEDDGVVGEDGTCSGEFLIFNGKSRYCYPPGLKTTWFNCCDTKQGSFLFLKEMCGESMAEVGQAISAKRAHYIGSYCAKKIKFIGCVQKAKTYCLFNSQLGRIIHEQGRPQLKDFQPGGNWGGPKNANCKGFTPEQFGSLDFSKIDMSEFFTEIQGKAAGQIRSSTANKVGDFMDNLQQ